MWGRGTNREYMDREGVCGAGVQIGRDVAGRAYVRQGYG